MKRRPNDHDIAEEITALLESDEDKGRHPDMEARSLIQQARDAGGGGLRMRYLEQAQRAIAKINPARHGRLISQLQSEVLALQGRRGDTKVAHVTPGEVVIPPGLQTPEVLAALRAAARAAGIDPSRLVVGSGRNSINPRTGQSEFSYGGSDRDTQRRDPPSGQQVADLYINHFPDAAHGYGHVGIGVNTGQTQGFYPRRGGVLTPLNISVPGTIRNDDLSQPHETLVIPTSKEQDAAVQEFINNRRGNPGQYNLYDRQCTDFVDGALHAAGISAPSNDTPETDDDMIPNRFFPPLKRQYRP